MPNLADIRAAHAIIRPHIHRTPVLTSSSLNREFGLELFFKCENFQKIGAFKARGATHAVLTASAAEVQGGVVTHSSGNHAAAIARAAALRGVPGYIVMPSNAPRVKVESVQRYGGRITFCEPTAAARAQAAAQLQDETGAVLIHPFDNDAVIAGQGTAALELLEAVPDLTAIAAPVGGGGLMSGTALAATELKPGIEVWAAEPALADDAARSLESGVLQPPADSTTIADGLRTGLSERTFRILQGRLKGVARAPEELIATAMHRVWQTMKILIEPSAAVPLAALLAGTLPARGRLGVILTGGNVEPRWP
ncbi:MAG: pyridoxal-phosphate dependent enzyme [Verrucomicrobia bacterium]|nr:pyridoxal-phosphate dependent enzyme [Verrucomicrobiota bacterium]